MYGQDGLQHSYMMEQPAQKHVQLTESKTYQDEAETASVQWVFSWSFYHNNNVIDLYIFPLLGFLDFLHPSEYMGPSLASISVQIIGCIQFQ